MEQDPADDLRRFLLEHVEDLEELQVLLALYNQGGDAGLAVDEIVAAIRLPRDALESALGQLAARGIISCSAIAPAVYRFDGVAARAAFGPVAAAYAENPVAVMMLMSSLAIERVRTAALRRFADCFRIGGPKSRG